MPSGGGRPHRPDHMSRKCYGCGAAFSGRAWLYRGTAMALCDPCHGTSRRKEDRDPVDTSDLIWRSAADQVLRNRLPGL